MNSRTYALFIWKSHRGLILFTALFVGLFQYLVIWLITSMDTASVLEKIISQLPPQMQVLLNEEFLLQFSAGGAIALGFNHPFILALVALSAISLPTRHIAGEIEDGLMELLLAYPIKRMQLLLSFWVSGFLVILFIIIVGLIGASIALLRYYEISYEIFEGLIKIICNFGLLFLLIMTFTLMISTWSRDGSKAGTYGAAITLIFYLIHFLSRIWDDLKITEPFNMFTYYQPQKLMFGEISFRENVFVLLILITVCLLISIHQFQRRDIPG